MFLLFSAIHLKVTQLFLNNFFLKKIEKLGATVLAKTVAP